MYLPRTPPPNISKSEPGVAVLYDVASAFIDAHICRHPGFTLAGARLHNGIRLSSVRRENRSSPEARKVASTSTTDTLILFFCGEVAFFKALLLAGTAVADGGAGEPFRLGSFEPTMISLPWVSIRSTGNAANLVSRAVGSFSLASAKSDVVAVEDGDVRDH
jgi:hypothetical protein